MKHYVATLVLLALVATAHFGLFQFRSHEPLPPFEFKNMDRVVDYVRVGTQDVEIPDWTKEILQTSDILIRDYQAPTGRPMQLTIVYARSTRRSLHLPGGCLVGAGWELSEQKMMPVGMTFSAKGLLLLKGDYRQAVLYWFKTGDHFTGDFFVNTFHWAWSQVMSDSPTSAMIKLSTPVIGNDVEGAFAQMQDFAAKLTPVLIENVP
jgi:EpsI family protein